MCFENIWEILENYAFKYINSFECSSKQINFWNQSKTFSEVKFDHKYGNIIGMINVTKTFRSKHYEKIILSQ